MNSMSRDHHNPCNSNHCCRKEDKDHRDCRNEDRDHRDCRKDDRDHRDCQPIVSCSHDSTSIIIPAGTLANTPFIGPSVKVNTCSLCNPVTKLDFTSFVTVTRAGAPGATKLAQTSRISFQVSRNCKGGFGPEKVGAPFVVSVILPEDIDSLSAAVSFTICDSKQCEDCCIYTITATTVDAIPSTIVFANPTIIATSSCGSDHCC